MTKSIVLGAILKNKIHTVLAIPCIGQIIIKRHPLGEKLVIFIKFKKEILRTKVLRMAVKS
jgi:hypothetical protein